MTKTERAARVSKRLDRADSDISRVMDRLAAISDVYRKLEYLEAAGRLNAAYVMLSAVRDLVSDMSDLPKSVLNESIAMDARMQGAEPVRGIRPGAPMKRCAPGLLDVVDYSQKLDYSTMPGLRSGVPTALYLAKK